METYASLKIAWWLLLGVLLVGLDVLVGMDMGSGAALRYFGRDDGERRAVPEGTKRLVLLRGQRLETQRRRFTQARAQRLGGRLDGRFAVAGELIGDEFFQHRTAARRQPCTRAATSAAFGSPSALAGWAIRNPLRASSSSALASMRSGRTRASCSAARLSGPTG